MHVKPTHKRHKPSSVKIPYDTDLRSDLSGSLKSPEGLQSLYILIRTDRCARKSRKLDTYKDLMKDAGSEEVTDAYESAVRGNEMILVCGEAALERFGREIQSCRRASFDRAAAPFPRLPLRASPQPDVASLRPRGGSAIASAVGSAR